MNKAVSPLNQFAKISGVSKMTVSRALREGTSVDPELRAKIRETARKLGYQPDSRISQVMRAVRKAQTSSYHETLAFICPHRPTEQVDGGSFFEEEFEGATRRAQKLGYRIDIVHLTNEFHAGKSLTNILNSRGIRGVLIAPPGPSLDSARIQLDWKQFCCVLIGPPFPNLELPRVQHDEYAGCIMILRHLKRLRYQRIGLIMSDFMGEESTRLIRSAFTSFHPLSSKEAQKLIFTDDHYEAKALKKWMTRAKPEVIVARFDKTFPKLDHIRRQAPRNVAIAAMNWDKNQLEIAGINQHRSMVGEQAVDLLLLRLQADQFGLDPISPSIKIPGSWMDGPSIRSGKPVFLGESESP
jgi:LacI family transcriptional regulator